MSAPLPPSAAVLKEVEMRVRHALAAHHRTMTEESPLTWTQLCKNTDEFVAWVLDPLTKEAPNGR